MWPRETLTTEVSMITTSVGSITVTATSHLFMMPPGLSALDEDGGDNGHPHPQQVVGVAPLVEGDPDGDPLDDLDIVPGGVLGRKQGKHGARAGHDAVHAAAKHLAGVGVHLDLDLLARLH